jgi:hypothetical protein
MVSIAPERMAGGWRRIARYQSIIPIIPPGFVQPCLYSAISWSEKMDGLELSRSILKPAHQPFRQRGNLKKAI